MSTATRILSLVVALTTLAVLASTTVATGSDLGPDGPSGFGSALVGSAPVGSGPSELAIDAATQTAYVANGHNDNGPSAGGDTVSVIDLRQCQARDVSQCPGPWPTIIVGSDPSGITIDTRTDTVYVANFRDNTVSVFNGATCNALVISGCEQTPATVPVGVHPIQLSDDPAHRTVYVANTGGSSGSTTVSMIDTATCHASDLAGCPTTAPPTVDTGGVPQAVDVDEATHTAYVTTFGALNGWTVFDTNTCNATVQSGCATTGTLPGDPSGPNDAGVDPANDTLYTANYDNTISAFDLHHCDAADLAGCATQTPGTVTPFPESGFDHDLWLVVDAPLHSVYVVFQKDDVLAVVDTKVCNGSDLAACATLSPPTIHTGEDPEAVALNHRTQTLYVPDEVGNDVSVIDATACNAQVTTGCRRVPPTVPLPGGGALAADPGVHTVYDASGPHTVSLIDTRTCRADQSAGCAQTPPTVAVGDHPGAIAIDRRTHTVYVANSGPGSSGSVSVIDADTCNAVDTAGCASVSTLKVPGGHPDDIAVDPVTDTLDVATTTASGPNRISVFDGATCDATTTTGCDQTPAVLRVGHSGDAPFASVLNIAVDKATNTVYATNVVLDRGPFLGNRVYVIDGATCDAVDTSGCGQTPASITLAPNPPIGSNPWGIAVDQRTDTIYTANIADGESAGSVSVIDGATCNGQDTAGCSQTPASVAVGFGAVAVAVDGTTDEVYVTNTEDASVSVIDGGTCNATNTTGCSGTPPRIAVGDYPGSITVDPYAGSVYVAGIEGVSPISLTP